MSRQSTANVRRSAAGSRNRSTGRRKPAKRYSSGRRKLRLFIGFAAILGGAALALLLVRGDVQHTIRSVTLPLKHEDIIRQQAQDKNVDADLIAAVIYSESRFRDQTSSAGARGLMQITPDTAKAIEQLSGGSNFELTDLSDPDLNIRYGTFYLRHLLDKFDENEVAAIAAYNAGETNVAEWGGADLSKGDIRFPETRAYVDTVLSKRSDYKKTYGPELGF